MSVVTDHSLPKPHTLH